MEEFLRKRAARELRDYSQWLKGNFVPTNSKLKSMIEAGFFFPAEVKTLDKPMDVAYPEDYFQCDSYKGLEEASAEIKDSIDSIPTEPDHGLEVLDLGSEDAVENLLCAENN